MGIKAMSPLLWSTNNHAAVVADVMVPVDANGGAIDSVIVQPKDALGREESEASAYGRPLQ